MDLSYVERVIWYVGMGSQLCLLLTLLARHRWSNYPLFTAFVVQQNLFTVLLVVVFRVANHETYRKWYWISEVSCFLFEIAVGAEVFRMLWRRMERPPSISRSSVIQGVIFSFFLATISAFSVGTATMPLIDFVAMRGAIFTSFLLCGCFISVSVYSNAMRIRKPRHAMIIGWGLSALAALEMSEDFRFFSQGWHRGSNASDQIEGAAYIVVLIYWMIGLWRADTLKWPRSLPLVVR